MATLVVPSPKSGGVDAYIRRAGASQTRNYGAATSLMLQSASATSFDRMLISFDLSSIPTGSTINSATLTVTNALNSMAGAQSCTCYPLTRVLVEGTGNGTVSGDGATWLTHDGTNSWTTAGGDYDAANGSAFSVSDLDILGTTYAWTITAAVAAAFVANVGGNKVIPLLFRLDTEGGATGSYAIYSSDHTTDANRPYLTVDYTSPGGMLRRNGGLFIG